MTHIGKFSDNVYHIPARDEQTPWSNPASYQPEPIDCVEQLRQRLREYRPSLFERFCDGAADFIADIAEHPSLAFVCTGLGVSLGMLSTVGLAFVWSMFL